MKIGWIISNFHGRIRVLRPWAASIRKRQVKSPKVYLRDSAVLHILLETESMRDLERHPKIAASWEGFLLESRVAAPWSHAGAVLFLGHDVGLRNSTSRVLPIASIAEGSTLSFTLNNFSFLAHLKCHFFERGLFL